MSECIIEMDGPTIQALAAGGMVNGEIVRCADCAKSEQAVERNREGSENELLVCARFGAFNHRTEPHGYCYWGERRTDG